MAAEAGLDLVEIAPESCRRSPRSRIGRFVSGAEEGRRGASARRPSRSKGSRCGRTRIHDYEVKMKAVRRFFEEGDKVKVTLRFRGREMAHQHLGMKVLDRVKEETAPIAKVEAEPKLEGRQMTMVLAPR